MNTLIDFLITCQLTHLIGEHTWGWLPPNFKQKTTFKQKTNYALFKAGEFVNIKLLTGQYAGFTVVIRWTRWKPELHMALVKELN